MITIETLQEFKERMHLGDDEDSNLLSILQSSYDDLRAICGEYDLMDSRFKELVFERSRYVYNDALEYFHANFLTQINNLSIGKALEGIVVEGDTSETV